MKHTNFFNVAVTTLLSFVLIFVFSTCSQNGGSSETPDTPTDSNESINMVSGEYQFVINSNNTVTITKYTGKDMYIEIPTEINEKKVTTIGNTAEETGTFQDCTTLVSVVIPDGIIEIQDNAFKGCTNLKTVKISDSVIFLGNYAFYNCPSLYSIYFEGNAPKVANYVLDPLPYLTIYHREGTEGWTNPWHGYSTSIYLESGEYYFKVNVDNTVTITKYNGKGVYIVIPTEIDGLKVTAVGNTFESTGAFQDCTTLVSVVIPEGVTEIQDNAFRGCINLKIVKIPDSVTLIWHCAFDACPNLQSIYFEGDAPQTGNYLFDYSSPLTIYYHEGSNDWTNPWYGCPTETY